MNDHKIDLFEAQYPVKNGVSYNSYLIESAGQSLVMDSVDGNYISQWFENIDKELKGKSPDYLVVQHMEPDHSAGILAFSERYKDAKIISSQKAFVMMRNFFGTDFPEKRILVKENDSFVLGEHTLTFISAPMVHWPEVIVTYDSYDKVLFTADGFGKFGANDVKTDEEWATEARRYYIGIVGKYGQMVQSLLKKVSSLDIKIICSLHGPVLKDDLSEYISYYDKWSSYTPEDDGITVAYTSIYGHTREAVLTLVEDLRRRGKTVDVYDLSRVDMSEAVASAFQHKNLVLATTTYNGDIFPPMRSFIEHLTERNYQKRRVGFIENGSWGPIAARKMKQMLEESKEIEVLSPTVTILSSLNEKSLSMIEELAEELA